MPLTGSPTRQDISCWREGYILKGFYFEQLNNLYRFFLRENVHIAITERVIKKKEEEYNRMFSFLKVDSYYNVFEEKFIGKKNDAISIQTLGLLKEIYNLPNERLFNMLEFEIPEWI